MNIVLWILGAILGALIVRATLGRRRWRVDLSNGWRSPRMTWFAARRLSRSWPGGLARVVRDGP